MGLRHLVEDARLRGGWGDAVHRDVVAGQLLAQRLGQRDDAGLRRRIGAGIGVALLAGDGGGIDDAAIAAAHHAGNHRLAAMEHAVQIDIEDALPFLDGIVGDGGVHAGNAGVADQDVDAAQRRDGLLLGFGHRVIVGHVHRHADGVAGKLLQRLLRHARIGVPDRHRSV